MKKSLPQTMFTDPERSRLSLLQTWVLDNGVTEIEMSERQFWIFAHLQPPAEKPWTTFMGRAIRVPDMPIDAQKNLGIIDNQDARRQMTPADPTAIAPNCLDFHRATA